MLNSNQQDSFYENQIDDTQQQAQAKKYHSILPDLATGWRPKNARIAAPIFIAYQDSLNEYVLQNALGCLPKLIYIGPRHDNSYKFHSLTQHCYNIKYGIKCEEVPNKLKKQLEEFTMKSNNRKGIFSGMNPSLVDKQLQFQSNFESGNLDIVVKVSANQYNLFLRPDTNTRGHMQWFYFRVCNQGYPHQKIKFNICNNRKAGVLFCRGMKPFVYSKHVQSTQGVKWQQCGENVQYKRLSEKQDFCSLYPKIQQFGTQMLSKYFCLSFQYTFQSVSDQVHFSYCPPYTYSEMKQQITELKKKANSSLIIQQQNLCTSLTGLQIPVLTITSSSNIKTNPAQQQAQNEQQRRCILVTGRFHPGQSNGSHVLKGFLQYLVSNQAEYLRNKIVFKIIPMINPDGVVFGNYRTSLSGKDLNRKFKAKNVELFPEIMNLKNFVIKLKKQEKMKIIYFLDFHGHSIKKNVFLYGPEYDIWSTKFQRAKILPKTIAAKTNMFRYQSCLFLVAAAKKTTARAFMLGLIPYCYTIQSSVGLYRSFNDKQKENFCFDPTKWEQMGQIIADSLKQTIMKIDKDVVNVLKKKKKSLQSDDFQSNKQNLLKSLKDEKQKIKENEDAPSGILTENSLEKNRDNLKQDLLQIIKQRSRDRSKIKSKQGSRQIRKQKTDEISSEMTISRSSSSKSNRDKSMNSSKSFIKNKLSLLQNACHEIKQVDGESDGYSEGKSDCESDDNDLDKEQYKKISGKIMKFIQNFNMSVVGQRRKNFRMRNKKKAPTQIKNKYYLGVRKTSNPDMAMVPSLKHKIFIKRQLSEKRIMGSQRQNSAMKGKKLSLYRLEQEKKKV